MAQEREITIEEMISYLNYLLEIDPPTISRLFQMRSACSEELAKSPVHVVMDENARSFVGVLGILNGLFGYAGTGPFRESGAIGTLTNKDGVIKAFIKVEDIEEIGEA